MYAARNFGDFEKRIVVILLVLLLSALQQALFASLCRAEPMRLVATESPAAVQLTAGKSLILKTERSVRRVSVASPQVAEVLVISPRQIYVAAKAAGSTNLTLWGEGDEIMAVYDLAVGPDVSELKRALHLALPGEGGLKVLPVGGSVALSGTVSSSARLTTALALAEAYSPGKVLNLLQVGGVHQVMLEVRVAEMSRTVLKRLGFNFNYIAGGDVFYSFLAGLTSLNDKGQLILSDRVAAAFTNTKGLTSWSGFLDALKENGLLRILAEPNLVCVSGQSASFLAGGEIPIPVPQGLGTTAIEFKSFGVGLTFTPTVLDQDRISVHVQPEVSEPDYSNSVQFSGFRIPAMNTRRASTTVELASGQTFAVAGLIKDSTREAVAKFPVLGDVPILGMLFRSSEFQKNESELVILVTPRLARPVDMAGLTLPTDGYREPDDADFYLFGRLEGKAGSAPKAQAPASAGGEKGGFDGEFGHILPQ